MLVQTYQNVLKEAERIGLKKIAFPLLGGGHHGYPPDYALACAEQTLEEYESKGLEAVLVLF